MNSRHGRIHPFLIIAISLGVVVFPIHLYYNNLSEIESFSPVPAFEVLDQEDLLAQEENNAKVFTLRFSCAFCPFSLSFIGPFPSLSFQTHSVDLLISILRC